MEIGKRLPKSFFEKSRPTAPVDSFKDIIPINWSNDVLNGKKKVIVELPKEKKR